MNAMLTGIVLVLASAVWAGQAAAGPARTGPEAAPATARARPATRTVGAAARATRPAKARAQQRLRRQHVARVRRRDRAHQHVRRQHLRCLRQRGLPHVSVRARRPITRPDTRRIRPIPPITRRSPYPTTRRAATAARPRPGPSSAWRPARRWPRPTRGRNVERLRGGSRDRQRDHGGGDRVRLQRRRGHRCRDGERPRVGHVRHGDELCGAAGRLHDRSTRTARRTT